MSLAAVASFGCDAVAPNDAQNIGENQVERPQLAVTQGSSPRPCGPGLPAHIARWLCKAIGANDPSRIVQIRKGAPRLETRSVSFYAVRGQIREARIFFTNGAGGRGSEYLRITILSNSLQKRPNGTPIPPGDSILITMRVEEGRAMIWQLLPEGLTFSPTAPAQLVAHYIEADKDFDHDGDEDAIDLMIEGRLAIWRQPLGQPFAQLNSILDPSVDRVSADVPGFSRFAIAY